MKSNTFLFLTILLLFSTTSAYSGTNNHSLYYGVNAGLGLSYFNDAGVICRFDTYLQVNKILLSIRYTGNHETTNHGLLWEPGDWPARHANEVGLLAGYMVIDNSRIELSIAGGGAVIGGLNRGAFLRNEKVTAGISENYYESKQFLSAGFPADFQIKYTTDHHFAIGFNIASCLSSQFSYISAMVIFTVGKIK